MCDTAALLHGLLRSLQDYRTAIMASASDGAQVRVDLPGLASDVERRLAEMVELERRTEDGLGMGGELDELAKSWQTLKTEPSEGLSDRHAFRLYQQQTDVIRRVSALLGMAVDRSKLTLDPEIATYYLMDGLMLRLPVVTEQLARMEAIAASASGQNFLPERVKAALATSSVIAEDQGVALLTSLAKAAEGSPKAQGAPDAAVRLKDGLDMARTVAQGMALANGTYSTDEVARAFATPAVAARELAQPATTQLEELLGERLLDSRTRLLSMLGGVTILLLLMAYCRTHWASNPAHRRHDRRHS